MAVDEAAMFSNQRILLASGATVLYPGDGQIVSLDDIVPVFRRAAGSWRRTTDTCSIQTCAVTAAMNARNCHSGSASISQRRTDRAPAAVL